MAGTAAIIVRRCVTGANRPAGQMSNTPSLQIINAHFNFVFLWERPGRVILSVSQLANIPAMLGYGGILHGGGEETGAGGEVKAGRR